MKGPPRSCHWGESSNQPPSGHGVSQSQVLTLKPTVGPFVRVTVPNCCKPHSDTQGRPQLQVRAEPPGQPQMSDALHRDLDRLPGVCVPPVHSISTAVELPEAHGMYYCGPSKSYWSS